MIELKISHIKIREDLDVLRIVLRNIKTLDQGIQLGWVTILYKLMRMNMLNIGGG